MTNKNTRSNPYCGEVLDLGKAKRTNGLVLNPTASPYETRLYYSKVFMDPTSRGITCTRRSTSVRQGGSAATRTDGPSSARFRSLQFNAACTNCDRIFRAIMFLRNRLPEKAHLRDPSFRFILSKDSASFRELATELGSAEPSLVGVTATALFSVYERIVKERRNLDAWLKVATDEPWKDTRLAEMALDLVHTEDQIRERERRQRAHKDEEKGRDLAAEEAATNERTLRAMLGYHDDWIEANEAMADMDKAKENVEEEVARASSSTDPSFGLGLTSRPSASTVDTAPRSTSATILSGTHATPNLSQPSNGPSHAQSNELSVIRPHLEISQPTGPLQPRRLFVVPGPTRVQGSTSDSTDTDPPSSPPFESPSTTLHRPAKRTKHAITPDSDNIALLTGRVKELEERNEYLTARIDHLTQRLSNHRTWLEEERLPKFTNRMTDMMIQLIEGQNVLFKSQMDQITARVNTHLYELSDQLNAQGGQLNRLNAQESQLTNQLNAQRSQLNRLNAQGSQLTDQLSTQGSQLNAQLYAQGSQLILLKTQLSQLNSDMLDLRRELRKLIATAEISRWESPPLRIGARSCSQW